MRIAWGDEGLLRTRSAGCWSRARKKVFRKLCDDAGHVKQFSKSALQNVAQAWRKCESLDYIVGCVDLPAFCREIWPTRRE